MQISSRAVMFWGCRWETQTFNSLQRFSMGLRSGDWLGHSRTLKCFLRSHSFVARAVCLGSLSCWKTQPRFIFNALADGRRFSLKISRYMAFDPTGWDLAWSPRSREIISGLVCLPFSNNCSHSWFLHTKLLTYCRFSLPSLVQVYNFVSGVLWQLFGLGHSGVWSVTVWGCGQVSFILITSSNRCH